MYLLQPELTTKMCCRKLLRTSLFAITLFGLAVPAHAQESLIEALFQTESGKNSPAPTCFFDVTYQDIEAEFEEFESSLRATNRRNPLLAVTQTRPVPAGQSDTTPPVPNLSPQIQSPNSRQRNGQNKDGPVIPPATPSRNSTLRPAAPPRVNPRTNTSRRSPIARKTRRPIRLARAPNMFGDFFSGGPSIGFLAGFSSSPSPQSGSLVEGSIQLPTAFGGRRLKISENYGLVPQHRVYFNYNHFEQTSKSFIDDGSSFSPRISSLDIWTVGLEKPFGEFQDWSYELRLPIYGNANSVLAANAGSTPEAATSAGSVGNLSLVLKHVFQRTESLVCSGGLGISLPTGKDVTARVLHVTTTLENETVDVTPWFGISYSPNDRWFHQFFTQVNVPLNGNPISYAVGSDPNNFFSTVSEHGTLGDYNLQSLFSVDLSSGYWLYRNPGSRGLTGLAAVLELHYTSTLQDSDFTSGYTDDSSVELFLNREANQQDILNLTLGMHTTINDRISLRLGHVIPLRNAFDRPFSSETQVQLNVAY